MTPADFLLICLAIGVLSGARLVLRGSKENAIIGYNIAAICAITGLVLLEAEYKVGFSSAIAICLVFPGAFGSILYAKFLRGGIFR